MQHQQIPALAYFFDDEGPKTSFDFTSPNIKHQKDIHTPAILKNILVCKNIQSNFSTEGHYALHNGILAYYGNNEGVAPIEVLDLNFSRLKLPAETEQTAIFTLMKNNCSFELKFPNMQVMDAWTHALKNVCIMTNFHEEYKATKMIGKGSFAKVYLVDAKSDGKQYAVKAFAKDGIAVTSKANPKATMLNEINLMRALVHDNIIQLHEVHETERSIYLVMELVEGRPLQEPLSRRTFRKEFSEKKIVEMIGSILDALAYIASKGIMHRDLKPDNILLDKNGKLKIVDFGLATLINIPEYIFKKCGTPGYIAPEVFRFDPKASVTAYNDRCDVFSAGCILYYMLFGQAFFHGKEASEILQLNKEMNEFDSLYSLKKELLSTKSKTRRDGIELIIQLLEYDHKKRISAAQALNHPYFTEIQNHLSKEITSFTSRDIALDSPKNQTTEPISSLSSVKNADDKHSLSLRIELSDKVNALSPSRNRFTMKNSLYLDVGKPDFNGKLDSVSNGSMNHSLFTKGGETPLAGNSNSVSSFARQTSLNEQKGNKSNKKAHHNPMAHNFLKAAIFNNMQKKIEPNTPTTPFENYYHDLSNGSGRTSSQGSSDEEFDDVGNEDCQIQKNFDKINKVSTPKTPSKMLHVNTINTQTSRSAQKKM